MAMKKIAKIGGDIFERTIPASFTHSERGCAAPRWTGKPLQIAVEDVPPTGCGRSSRGQVSAPLIEAGRGGNHPETIIVGLT
jgi:hypothetical protein